ncbi:MAG TPA: c-type cytochrome [Azonexus sp.]|nr:c-type cytochrome [Azonexus sp.]
MKMHPICFAVCLTALLGNSLSWASGDPKKGADVFAEECGDCHSVAPGKNKKGPSLLGLNGRKAGSVVDFSGYSDAMKQSAIVWSPERIDAYIAQPRKVVAGGKMKYDGLPDAGARADVIAYLTSLK